MDLDSVSFHKHAQKNLVNVQAILTSHVVYSTQNIHVNILLLLFIPIDIHKHFVFVLVTYTISLF